MQVDVSRHPHHATYIISFQNSNATLSHTSSILAANAVDPKIPRTNQAFVSANVGLSFSTLTAMRPTPNHQPQRLKFEKRKPHLTVLRYSPSLPSMSHAHTLKRHRISPQIEPSTTNRSTERNPNLDDTLKSRCRLHQPTNKQTTNREISRIRFVSLRSAMAHGSGTSTPGVPRLPKLLTALSAGIWSTTKGHTDLSGGLICASTQVTRGTKVWTVTVRRPAAPDHHVISVDLETI